jgi:hypothetical protein
VDDSEQKIRKVWAMVLESKDCIEIYEYINNVILNMETPLNQKFILELLKMAKPLDLPCKQGPYGNLRNDIEHYIKVYGTEG